MRVARNPLTNETQPFVYVGRLVPNSGNFINGMAVYDNTPQKKNPFKVAPRLGFAWDVTGDGKTAVRGGAGVFYDRYSDDNILDLDRAPTSPPDVHDQLHDRPGPSCEPVDGDADGGAPDRGVRSAGGLQLEPRRAAGHRLETRSPMWRMSATRRGIS